MREVPPMLVSPPDTAGLSSAPVAEKKVDPTLNGAPGGATSIEGVDKNIYIYIYSHIRSSSKLGRDDGNAKASVMLY